MAGYTYFITTTDNSTVGAKTSSAADTVHARTQKQTPRISAPNAQQNTLGRAGGCGAMDATHNKNKARDLASIDIAKKRILISAMYKCARSLMRMVGLSCEW